MGPRTEDLNGATNNLCEKKQRGQRGLRDKVGVLEIHNN